MSDSQQSQLSFGAKLKELEKITDWFEGEDVDLNDALIKFERGMALAADLKSELKEIENRVEVIKQRFDEPAPTTEPLPPPPLFDDDSPTLF